MKFKKKIALIPSAYNPAVMGDIENFIDYYKEDFDVYVFVNQKFKNDIEKRDGVCYITSGTRLERYVKAAADYLIDAGTVSGDRHSNSQKRISVWHGIPYKKMFVDLANAHRITALDYAGSYDLMISPSKWYTERFLRQSMLYEGEVLETAVSRTDSLFLSDASKEEIRHECNIPADKKVLLYAPTFREEGDFTLPFSPDRVKASLGEDWVIVTKVHYLNKVKNAGGVIDATSYGSVNNLLAITDLLITDYSSLLFDYSVLGKPALLYQYDREEYEAERSFMFDMEDYVDGKDIVFTEEALYDRLKYHEVIGNNLSRIKETFYPHQKEHATQALVKQLDFDVSTRQISEVIFLVNDLNEIGGVHTFVTNLAGEFKEKYNAKIYVFGINEFNTAKDMLYEFDPENLIDVKISQENYPGTCKAILEKTDGLIITCQYSAQLAFQESLADKNVVLMFHGDAKDIVNRTLYSWHLDRLNNGQLFNYRRLAFLTEGNAELMKAHLKEELRDKVISMENGFDFAGEKNLYKENGEFVFVSRLDPDKNPMEVIDLFLHESIDPKYKLHIYGDGVLREAMQKKVSEAGAEDRIIFHGYETDKEVIYADKQGTISISLTEGLPLTFLESIHYGIPVYAYGSFTSCKDILDETNGVIVQTGDKDAFVSALNQPFDMTGFSRESMTTRFSNDVITGKWKDLFDDLYASAENKQDYVRQQTGIQDKKEKWIGKAKKRIRESAFFQDNEYCGEVLTVYRNIRHRSRNHNRPLVSIIMPFYYNIDTIKAAVRSVRKSGYKNFELLLINDGSDQDPMAVLPKDDRIRYFYKENGGLSDTRNFGMDRAKGEYVIFLDSDDVMYPDALHRLVDYAEKHDLQMVCGRTMRRNVITKEENPWYRVLYRRDYINTIDKRRILIDDTIATSKLYRMDMIRETGIQFKDGLFEDLLFTGQLYAQIDRIGVIRGNVQKWMVYGTNTSITTKRTFESAVARITNIDEVFRMQTTNMSRMYYTRQFIRHHIIAVLNGFANYNEEERKKIYEMLRESLLLREPYIVERYIIMPSKQKIYKALLEDDYEGFEKLAEAYAELAV